ncbi:MAG: GntR family transcriptional regulator [Steroidobacteraceae bacterium]|jgi:DNA-binding GntR family transcriptional regulator|nr:GntR family transcriptional regulator [Steroidobacteraceae bacterium]
MANQAVTKTVSDQLATALRDRIIDGQIAPGQRLLQEEVARDFNVSITPVREAITRLAALGIVKADARRGAQVVSPTARDLTECYAIRLALEPLALEWAVPNFTATDLKRLDELVAEMQDVTDPQRYVELNHQFHGALYERANSERLCSIVESVRSQAAVYLLMLGRAAGSDLQKVEEHANEDHRRILEACRQRDTATAVQVLRAHLDEGLASVRRALGL